MAASHLKAEPQANADGLAPDLDVSTRTSRSPRDVFARAKRWLAEHGDNRLMQRVAGTVFLVRVASALLALVSQVLMARWMGSHEFGI